MMAEKSRRLQVIAIVIWFAAGLIIGYAGGDNNGMQEGVKLAHAENDIRVSEHDRIMQRIGVCNWAKIMAEDIRCAKQLP